MANPSDVARRAFEGRIKPEETRALRSDMAAYMESAKANLTNRRNELINPENSIDAEGLQAVIKELDAVLEESTEKIGTALAFIDARADDDLKRALTAHVAEKMRSMGYPEGALDERFLAQVSPDFARVLADYQTAEANYVIAEHNLQQIEGGTTNFVAPRTANVAVA